MTCRRLLLVAFVICISDPTLALNLRITGIQCNSKDISFSVFERCDMRPVSRGVKEISLRIKLLQVPVTNVTLRFEIQRRGYPRQNLYSFDIDACKFLSNSKGRRNFVANAIYELFQFDKYTNMNHSCPFDHDLIVDRFRADHNLKFVIPIAMGKYVLKSYWLAYNVLRATFNVNVQFWE